MLAMFGLYGIIYCFKLLQISPRVVLFVNVNNCYLKCSYTIPHKEAGFNCCDEIDPIAKVSSYVFTLECLFHCHCTFFHTIIDQDIQVCLEDRNHLISVMQA